MDSGVSWFSGLAPKGQQEVLQEVTGYAMQAHITSADGRAGVARSGVKPTANPSVMICMDPPRYGFAGLPAAEHVTAFRVLVSVFAVADTRRRDTYCKGACGHAWHNLRAATEQLFHRRLHLWPVCWWPDPGAAIAPQACEATSQSEKRPHVERHRLGIGGLSACPFAA
ncbi:DUF5958 family protein [Streptomyces sp. NPDC001422]|uniref:DUF5958 family protein n=1 Tax=Streptomyces sp. NPDC001422 TaxID=3364575 RepID=UPI00367D6176